MMDKRTILVTIGCLLALLGWPLIVSRLYPPIPKKPRVISAVVTSNHPPAQTATAPATNVTAAIHEAPPAVGQQRTAEQRVVLSNDFIRAEFTSWGGGIRSIE